MIHGKKFFVKSPPVSATSIGFMARISIFTGNLQLHLMKQYIALILIASLFLLSCKKDKIEGDGPIVTEKINVKNFYGINISTSSKVYITQGNTFEVQVKVYENLLPSLTTTVEDGTLHITYKINSNINNDNSEFYITMPSLTGLALSGNGSIETKGQFIGSENFVINASGSGVISMGNGSANNLRIIIDGSSNVKTFGFPVQRAEITLGGSGNAEVNVAKTLNATINGSGNIYYKGAAESITSKITGSGQVINAN
jgi:hypothetical protein